MPEPASPYALKIVAEDAAGFTVGGYGVVFGGRDLVDDYFTRDSNLWLDLYGKSAVTLYQHGRDPIVGKAVFGRTGTTRVDDVGVWVERQVELSNKYAAGIRDLVKSGRLGYSSGAIAHLVERAGDGHLRSWPVVEWSLTPNPAEPRTLGVQRIKSLPGLYDDDPDAPPFDLEVRAVWTAATINDLPDSAFAVVESGGTKDGEGKTVPRSLRHFPHHGPDGAVDLPHLRNALARAPQSPFGDRAMPHLERHASAAGVGDRGGSKDAEPDDHGPERVDEAAKAGRVMSGANQTQLHTAMRAMQALHDAGCTTGDCGMVREGKSAGAPVPEPEPEPDPDAEDREQLELLLAATALRRAGRRD